MNDNRLASAQMAQHEDPRGNRLLAALTYTDWQRWRPQLECVDLARGQVLHRPGRRRRHAYFPTSAVVSLLCTVASGASTEIAVVGNEGVVGKSVLLGDDSATNGNTVLIAGRAFRIGARAIQDEFDRSDAVRCVLLRYIQALATQIAQTAICNRHHSIEQQLCGFLLNTLDRLQGREFMLTQDLIASMLGVRRESVTAAAGQLQEAGLIQYTRGHVAVLDRVGIERRTCECYAVVKKEFDRLLPQEPQEPEEPHSRLANADHWSAWREAAVARCTPQREVEAMSEP